MSGTSQRGGTGAPLRGLGSVGDAVMSLPARESLDSIHLRIGEFFGRRQRREANAEILKHAQRTDGFLDAVFAFLFA